MASFGSFVRMDFENDQWTFFKPLAVDLEVLFGVDIHEVQPYRAIPQQVAEVIALGRTMTIELDAWYLPDTAATSYGTAHVKTGVIAEAIDLEALRFQYFHNASLYELSGDDFRGAFRLGEGWSADVLPPYTELIRFDAGPRLSGDALRAEARTILRGHLDRVVPGNPFDRFGARLAADLPALLDGDAALYHAYTFATFRMAGAAFELLASHVDWLLDSEGSRPAEAMGRIVEGCKVLGFKLARRRAFDPTDALLSPERRLGRGHRIARRHHPLTAWPPRWRPPEPRSSGMTSCPSSTAGKRPRPPRMHAPRRTAWPASPGSPRWCRARPPGPLAKPG